MITSARAKSGRFTKCHQVENAYNTMCMPGGDALEVQHYSLEVLLQQLLWVGADTQLNVVELLVFSPDI